MLIATTVGTMTHVAVVRSITYVAYIVAVARYIGYLTRSALQDRITKYSILIEYLVMTLIWNRDKHKISTVQIFSK